MNIDKIYFKEILSEKDLKFWSINDLSLFYHQIKRIFFIDSSKKTTRGNHAHKLCWQTLINIKGSIIIEVDNGSDKTSINLEKSGEGIVLPPMFWSKQIYSNNSVLMVACSELYEEEDYIRNYDEFRYLIKQ